eukprot:TRINITY_DN34545_c0_g1_i1.p2 TRINITY_DN34545_c0_g1~~TRINITY_DN34545_c0_g1_i1.p2  ORF type:complete len:195 (+),score=66.09 TRINITY_DN34545_c0_g1_i1:79-663(+)
MAWQMRLGKKATEAMAGQVDAAPGQSHGSELICSICDTPAFASPVKTTTCGHLFDKACLEQWLVNKDGDKRMCPVFRETLPPGAAAYGEADHIVKAILAGIEVQCPQGCEQPKAKRVRYDSLATHLRACPMTPTICDSDGCGVVLLQKDLDRALACEQCKEQVKRSAMQEHRDSQCAIRLFQCSFCKEAGLVYN